jgi:serine/threonine protein kinase
MEAYEKLRIVGRGAFGVVQLCRRKSDGRLVIVKQIPVEEMSKEERQAALNEVAVRLLWVNRERERGREGRGERERGNESPSVRTRVAVRVLWVNRAAYGKEREKEGSTRSRYVCCLWIREKRGRGERERMREKSLLRKRSRAL